MGANRLLIIQAPEIRQRMTDLLTRIDGDEGLRQLYINDPAGVIQKFVFPDQTGVPAAEINRGNRLLYSLLSNAEFLTWARDYEQALTTAAREATEIEDPGQALSAYLTIIDRGRIHKDLAEAVARFSDKELIASMTWRPDASVSSANLEFTPSVSVDIETFIYAVALVIAFGVAAVAVLISVPAAAEGEVLNRMDIQNIASQLSAQLSQRAAEVRASGILTDFTQRDVGYTR
jgi:hypothetical protein